MTVSEVVESVGAGNLLAILIFAAAVVGQQYSFRTHVNDFEKSFLGMLKDQQKDIQKLEDDSHVLTSLGTKVTDMKDHIMLMEGKLDMILKTMIDQNRK